MNPVIKKTTSIYKRLKNGFQLTCFPEKFYLYHKEQHLYHNLSYSQEGEDMILARYFGDKKYGFYVDVGAHAPQRFSNTYYFYLQGWKGINIDAKPGSVDIFNKTRANDINLEMAISDSHQVLTYYEFNEPALNGFCEEISKDRDGLCGYQIISTKEIKTITLSEVLDQYLPQNQEINFISVDVEGLDLQVLKSNNWSKYRPKMVLVEALNISEISRVFESELGLYMRDQGYEIYAKSINTIFFVTER